MKIQADRQNVKTKKNRILPLSVIIVGAALASAVSIPGCGNTEALNAQITQLQTTVDSQAKRYNELSTQFKTVNDEHNTLKQLVNQVSDVSLTQKAQIESLQAEVKTLTEKLSKASATRTATPTRAVTKPATRSNLPSQIRKRR